MIELPAPDPLKRLPNLRHLKVFEAVGRHESINAAASAINLSQPAVTYAIKRVEEFFGSPLVARSTQGTYLSDLGRLAYRRVSRFHRELGEAVMGVGAGAQDAEQRLSRITNLHISTHLAMADDPMLAFVPQALGVMPATSLRAIRELERTLGAQLYEQTSEGRVVTRKGRELARQLGLAVREIDLAHEEIAEANGERRVRVTIGILHISSTSVLSHVIERMARTEPSAQIEIVEGSYEANLDLLRRGRIDFIFGILNQRVVTPDLLCEPLFNNPYVIVANKAHPLFRKDTVTLADLAAEEWISTQRGTPRRQALERLFRSASFPRVVIETTSLSVHKSLLRRSNRLSLLPRFDFDLEAEGNLAIVDRKVAIARPSDGLTLRRNWEPSRVQRKLLELFREVSLELPEIGAPQGVVPAQPARAGAQPCATPSVEGAERDAPDPRPQRGGLR
ncbi:MAG: hypothetical protein ABS76_07545 [Pelagibacterium sp. SCN 64-44]|nr:MAG: hypothetical protein ABS76_07545 [Pelagibacterium sp. SCN 64-44]